MASVPSLLLPRYYHRRCKYLARGAPKYFCETTQRHDGVGDVLWPRRSVIYTNVENLTPESKLAGTLLELDAWHLVVWYLAYSCVSSLLYPSLSTRRGGGIFFEIYTCLWANKDNSPYQHKTICRINTYSMTPPPPSPFYATAGQRVLMKTLEDAPI